MLLAIDTSTDWTGIALFDGTQILAEQIWRGKHYQSVELVPAIKECLANRTLHQRNLAVLAWLLARVHSPACALV